MCIVPLKGYTCTGILLQILEQKSCSGWGKSNALWTYLIATCTLKDSDPPPQRCSKVIQTYAGFAAVVALIGFPTRCISEAYGGVYLLVVNKSISEAGNVIAPMSNS